jgi:hypothetical protein
MATTAIFAEILIVGLQATVWVALAVTALLDFQWGNLDSLSNWDSLITVFILASAYTLGIIVDRVADSMFDPLDRRLRKKALSDKQPLPEVHKMRLTVMALDDERSRFLDYVRSRVRVARATAFNLALIIITSLFLISRRPQVLASTISRRAADIVILIGLILLAMAAYAWVRITRTFYWRLAEAYQILQEQVPDESSQTRPSSEDAT